MWLIPILSHETPQPSLSGQKLGQTLNVREVLEDRRLWAIPRPCCFPFPDGHFCGVARDAFITSYGKGTKKIPRWSVHPLLFPPFAMSSLEKFPHKEGDLEAQVWMQNNFIESKVEKAETHRGHQEQTLRCNEGVHLPGLQRERRRPTGPQQAGIGW